LTQEIEKEIKFSSENVSSFWAKNQVFVSKYFAAKKNHFEVLFWEDMGEFELRSSSFVAEVEGPVKFNLNCKKLTRAS